MIYHSQQKHKISLIFLQNRLDFIGGPIQIQIKTLQKFILQYLSMRHALIYLIYVYIFVIKLSTIDEHGYRNRLNEFYTLNIK